MKIFRTQLSRFSNRAFTRKTIKDVNQGRSLMLLRMPQNLYEGSGSSNYERKLCLNVLNRYRFTAKILLWYASLQSLHEYASFVRASTATTSRFRGVPYKPYSQEDTFLDSNYPSCRNFPEEPSILTNCDSFKQIIYSHMQQLLFILIVAVSHCTRG
jgi:hypothetical protein